MCNTVCLYEQIPHCTVEGSLRLLIWNEKEVHDLLQILFHCLLLFLDFLSELLDLPLWRQDGLPKLLALELSIVIRWLSFVVDVSIGLAFIYNLFCCQLPLCIRLFRWLTVRDILIRFGLLIRLWKLTFRLFVRLWFILVWDIKGSLSLDWLDSSFISQLFRLTCASIPHGVIDALVNLVWKHLVLWPELLPLGILPVKQTDCLRDERFPVIFQLLRVCDFTQDTVNRRPDLVNLGVAWFLGAPTVVRHGDAEFCFGDSFCFVY